MNFKKKMRVPFSLGLFVASISFLMVGCVASTAVPEKALLSGELVQLSENQHTLDLRLQKLQDNLILLEAKVQDQQKLIDDLKNSVANLAQAEDGSETLVRLSEGMEPAKAAEGSPTEVYQKAFADYASKRFQRAVSGFETFVRLYPTNDHVANALFWLGESYANLQEPALALDAYGRIADRYPDWGKTPEVLLKSAAILHRLNRIGEAQTLLEILREKYPKSNAAKKSLEDPRFQSESQP